VSLAFEKKLPAMYTTYMGASVCTRQFRGSVCHINRDERERERRGDTRKNVRRKRERKSEKNGEKYVRTGGETRR